MANGNVVSVMCRNARMYLKDAGENNLGICKTAAKKKSVDALKIDVSTTYNIPTIANFNEIAAWRSFSSVYR